jgi:hypothetical protein
MVAFPVTVDNLNDAEDVFDRNTTEAVQLVETWESPKYY